MNETNPGYQDPPKQPPIVDPPDAPIINPPGPPTISPPRPPEIDPPRPPEITPPAPPTVDPPMPPTIIESRLPAPDPHHAGRIEENPGSVEPESDPRSPDEPLTEPPFEEAPDGPPMPHDPVHPEIPPLPGNLF